MRRDLLAFAIANVVALAWALFALLQPWVGADPDETQRAIAQRYVPFALVLAACGTALVATVLSPERRAAFLRRHFAIYLLVPAILFPLSRGEALLNGQIGAIYLFAIALWTAHALEGMWHVVANLQDARAALLLAGVLLVPFLALMPYHRAVMPTASDEPHYLVIVQSLLADRDLDLKNEYDSETYRAYYPDRLPDRHIIQVGEAQFPIRDLGLPILSAVPFAIGGRLGVEAFMCLVGAALAAQLYLACRDLGVAHRAAFLGTAIGCLAHPVLTYTTQIYPELLAALAFMSAARLLRDGRAASAWSLAGASALLGVLPWLSTRAILIAVGAGLVVAYCALRPLDRRPATMAARAIAAAAPFVVFVVALSALNWRMFGLFMPGAGYYVVRDQQQVLTFAPQVGALGLLFDRVFGLIPRAPIFLIAAIGAIPLWRRGSSATLIALLLGWSAYLLFIADIAYWWADGSPPSRYLLAGIPLVVVALAAGLEQVLARGGAWRAAAAVLAAASLFIGYVYAALPDIRYDLALDVRASGSEGALFTFLGRIVRPDPALLAPSLVQAAPLDLAMGALWLVLVVALAMFGANKERRQP